MTPGPSRLRTLGEARDFVKALDLSGILGALLNPTLPWDPVFDARHAAFAEQMYRRWLLLRRTFEHEILPPTVDIDAYWHAHILDTHAYVEMCDRVFGYYVHHYPYFGMRGDADRQALESSFDLTRRRYQQEFGEPLYEWDYPSERPR